MIGEIVGYGFEQLIEMETKEVFCRDDFLVVMVNDVDARTLDLFPIT